MRDLEIGRANLPDSGGELLGSVDAGDLNPCGLIYTDTVEDSGELVTVLSVVDHLRVGTQNVDVVLLKPEGDVLRELS